MLTFVNIDHGTSCTFMFGQGKHDHKMTTLGNVKLKIAHLLHCGAIDVMPCCLSPE